MERNAIINMHDIYTWKKKKKLKIHNYATDMSVTGDQRLKLKHVKIHKYLIPQYEYQFWTR